MDWLTSFNVVAGCVTILAGIFGIYAFRRNQRSKKLVFGVTNPLSLFSVLPNEVDHRIVMRYEREGSEPVNIKEAYLHFVRVVNMGREPIRRDDIAATDPLRLEVVGSRVFDMSVVGVSRKVIGYDVEWTFSGSEIHVRGDLAFEFLDHRDGAIVRVITEDREASIKLRGTVIGMPKGIGSLYRIQRNRTGMFLMLVFVGMFITIGMMWVVFPETILVWGEGPPVVVKDKWLVGLASIVGVLGLSLMMYCVSSIVRPDRELPEALRLPEWFRSKTLFE